MLNGLRNTLVGVRTLSLVVLVLTFLTTGLASPSNAQTPVPRPESAKLQFDHDGAQTDNYTLGVDGGTSVVISPVRLGPAQEAGLFVFELPFPALTPGQHTLVVSACNLSGCASSDPFAVTVIVKPTKPSGLRIAFSPPAGGQ